MKPILSSLDLHALLQEFKKEIEGGRIDQIYQPSPEEFLIQIYKKSKKFLKIVKGGPIFLSSHKPDMDQPTNLALFMRRKINNSTLEKIEQIDSERIIKLTLQKEKKYFVYLELFSKGNLIFCDENDKILAVQEKQEWSARTLNKGKKYQLPPPTFDFIHANKKEITKRIKEDSQKKIVKVLAANIGLSGLYGEEICSLIDLDKNKKVQDLTKKELEEITKQIQQLIKKTTSPKGYLYKKNIAPLKCQTCGSLKKEFPSFNQALNKVLTKTKKEQKKQEAEEKYKDKIDSLKHIIKEQKSNIKRFRKQIKAYQRKGEYIYENYHKIKPILDKINQIKEKKGWQTVKKELKQIPQIKKIDLKEKKITVKFK